MEQRLVELSFNVSAPGTLTATAPPNGFIAPPGYYMLFILNSAGVPSVAKFVHLTSTPTDQPPIGTITSPTGDVTIQAGGSLSFAGSAADPDGPATAFSWIFPGGTPSASALQSPGLITFAEVGTNVISMTAIDGLGVNDPSPPTRMVIVQTRPVTCTNTISTSSSPSGGGTTSGGGTKNCGSSVLQLLELEGGQHGGWHITQLHLHGIRQSHAGGELYAD
jgi:hypothetical protein